MPNSKRNSAPSRKQRWKLYLLLLVKHLRRCRRDPDAFLEYCFTQPDGTGLQQAAVHRDLQLFLTQHAKALVELPRDHGKSTQICGRLVWELGHRPALRIKLVCAAERLALDRGRFLRSAIADNRRVQLVFPHLRRGAPWSAECFTIQRSGDVLGPSVGAFGIGAASTGSRADLLVCDDVVDVKAVHSAVERDRVSSDFFNNLLNLLEPDGRFWSLSTPWHNDDLNARLKKNPAYTLFRRAVGKEDLEPVWPAKWPTAELAKRRAEIGDAAFARGYWLTPVAEDEIVIKPQWVRYYDDRPTRFDQVLLSVDPAASGKRRADRHGLVVLGRAGTTLYVLAASALRCGMTGLIAALESLTHLWNPDTIVFESNGAFEAVRELLVRHTAFGAKVRGTTQVRSKHDRATALSVSVQNGSLLFNGDGSQTELIEEMTTFPFAEHDDLLDALGTGVREMLNAKCQPRLWVMG